LREGLAEHLFLVACSQLAGCSQLGSVGWWQPESGPHAQEQNWEENWGVLQVCVHCPCLALCLGPVAGTCSVLRQLRVIRAGAVRGS